jgi:hypothetical protein
VVSPPGGARGLYQGLLELGVDPSLRSG